MEDKNFKGAIDIIEYFQQSGEDYRRIAHLFGGQHSESMLAVFSSNNWTSKDVERWRVTINKFHAYREEIRRKKTVDSTVIEGKKKVTRLRK